MFVNSIRSDLSLQFKKYIIIYIHFGIRKVNVNVKELQQQKIYKQVGIRSLAS